MIRKDEIDMKREMFKLIYKQSGEFLPSALCKNFDRRLEREMKVTEVRSYLDQLVGSGVLETRLGAYRVKVQSVATPRRRSLR